MDNKYAIYTYKFSEYKEQGNLFQDGQAKKADLSLAQDTFYSLFKPQNNPFPVQEIEDGKAKKYTCDIWGNDSRIVALRLFNQKEKPYWEKVDNPRDPMGMVVEKLQPSTPCTYVIIDCRSGKNILAVKMEKDAWGNPDTVRDLLEESINLQLESISCGFRVKLYTKMETRNFYEYSKHRIKREGRTIKHMIIHFKTGKLNPEIESIINTSKFLKGLFSLINKYALTGEMKFDKPVGLKLIDKRRHDIENIIALILSDPIGYGLDITFDDDVTLHCGKDVRADLPMEPDGALDLFHIRQKAEPATQLELFPDGKKPVVSRYLLEVWLDSVAEQTEKMKDAETIKSKRGSSNRRKVS